MDVYVVPTGSDRHELYCEPGDESTSPQFDSARGVWRRLQTKFSAVLAAVEREQERDPAAPASRRQTAGLSSRLRVRGLRWLAERVAEQRLLWKLQGQTTVRAYYPADIDSARAETIVRRNLGTDSERHFRWLIVDTVGLLFSLLLVPLPGPNVPGYYFTFRVVGHFLAIRGARQGLRRVAWDLQPSEPLAALAGLDRMSPADRASRVREIAARLGLSRLARFVERTTVETA